MVGLSILDATIALDDVPLFLPVTAHVPRGGVLALMGPSGCGKSSLLAWMCGTLDFAFTARGRVELEGRDLSDLPPERRGLGILFQDDLLFPHMSVGANLAFGVPSGVSRVERQTRVAAALTEAGLDGFAERDPATLSGGQRARAALMRTLLSEPGALLLDEPFSKLDIDLRARVRSFVFDHARRRSLPTVLVTHDPSDIPDDATQVIRLDRAAVA